MWNTNRETESSTDLLPDLCHWTNAGSLKTEDITLISIKRVLAVVSQLEFWCLASFAKHCDEYICISSCALDTSRHNNYFILWKQVIDWPVISNVRVWVTNLTDTDFNKSRKLQI